MKTKVEIVCKKHGSFHQTPEHHLRGAGCPHCAGNVKRTTKSFAKDAFEWFSMNCPLGKDWNKEYSRKF